MKNTYVLTERKMRKLFQFSCGLCLGGLAFDCKKYSVSSREDHQALLYFLKELENTFVASMRPQKVIKKGKKQRAKN